MDLISAMRTRRSLRALEGVEIDDEVLGRLMEAVSLSASCFNNQPWRMVFVRSPDVLDRVKSALNRGNVWATRASMIVAVCSRPEDDCRNPGRDYYLFDTGMATAHLLLRAHDLGLVAHPIAGYDPEAVRQVLGIPPEFTIITLVIVGERSSDTSLLSEKQKEAEKERPPRKRYSENFFVDGWRG